MKGVAIHISGIVQGVGFRPWVWRIAMETGLRGSVRNNMDGVWIELFGDEKPFFHALETRPPPLARVDSVETRPIEGEPPIGFQILESGADGPAAQSISPDIGLCADCRAELFEPRDRRYRYPFINCVNCGPRFSIIERLPYDRPNTSMRAFPMCDACRAEYENPANRRYHAQPIACPECGPRMDPPDWETVWRDAMAGGRVVAVKGVGGFHLACDALNPDAVETLRERKGRETKPFALMVPDTRWISEVCHLGAAEERLLKSRARPIVLLKIKKRFATFEALAPGLDTLGVMLPYAPAHEIMLHLFPSPVVMTSANPANEPMIHENRVARERLSGIADVFITHDRGIANRCDDPVLAVFGDQTIIARPGRGVAPIDFPVDHDQTIVAFGADMKNTFAISSHGRVTLYPYVGDLEHPETELILARGVERALKDAGVEPALVVRDAHPDYHSSRLARAFAEQRGVPTLAVQHHHAHLAGACSERAIGFAFDGTGYGSDETIWGGEVFVYDAAAFERVFHLRPFALPGGDLAVKEPRRVLYALLHQLGEPVDSDIAMMIEAEVNCPTTSSMGRLFDAAAVLLGACERPTYDGEAAIRLEAMADERETGDLAFQLSGNEIDWRPLFRDLLEEQGRGVAPSVLAARFHNTIAEIVYLCGRRLSESRGPLPWVFAGGVFQNRLLVERIKAVVGDEFELIFSPYPNDSGVAVGQIMIGARTWASK